MSDMMQDALADLDEVLTEHVSQTVTYRRGVDSAEVPATFGQKLLKLFDEFGAVRLEWTDMDFTISAAALAFGAQRITPRRGDAIDVTYADSVQTFEVLPLDGNEAPWRWSDPYQTRYRIHTKHIATAEIYG